MSENKKYYWLKLNSDFFDQKEIKKLRTIAGGDTYTIIYLKLQLLSLQHGGKLYFESIGSNFIDEMALTIDESIDNVEITINYLMLHKLIEQGEENEFVMPKAMLSIGKESESIERVRKHREKNKRLSVTSNVTCNADVTKCNIEIEKEIDIEIDIEIEKDIEKDKNNIKTCAPHFTDTELTHKQIIDIFDKSYTKLYNDKIQWTINNKSTRELSSVKDLLTIMKDEAIREKINLFYQYCEENPNDKFYKFLPSFVLSQINKLPKGKNTITKANMQESMNKMSEWTERLKRGEKI
jgi:predicted phage replisome organizer